jgi:hypothetical protein
VRSSYRAAGDTDPQRGGELHLRKTPRNYNGRGGGERGDRIRRFNYVILLCMLFAFKHEQTGKSRIREVGFSVPAHVDLAKNKSLTEL